MDTKEIDIEAPWGKIAAKLWGPEDERAVLTTHGIMDNAGSFDNLIPLLPKYFYICIDLPGHGKSDKFPPILPIHSEDYILALKVVADYFQRDKYTIMGHSYGGQIGLLFSRLYPDKIEQLILLDTIHFMTKPSQHFKDMLVKVVDGALELDRKTKTRSAPQYSYKEAVEKVMQSRASQITEKVASNLLKRMLRNVGEDKFELTLDQRLKFPLNPFHDNRYAIETLKSTPVQCPLLIILGTESTTLRNFVRPILNHFEEQKGTTIKYVAGYHDVHQVNPERVAPLITEFLNHKKSKL